MRNLLLIFFIMFSAFIFSNDNQIIKNNQKIDEKNYQNTKDNDKIEDLNTNTEKSKTIENPSVCFNDFKELEKDIEPKAYTDCREIKNAFCGRLNACYRYSGTCFWCRIVGPEGPTGKWGCY